MYENKIATLALDVCFKLHRLYGPGLFESVYEELFCIEWLKTGIPFERQKKVPLVHEGIRLDMAFKADLILDDLVLLEFKSIKELKDVHYKQVVTYLKLTGLKLGLLINFNESLLKDGIRRIVNNF